MTTQILRSAIAGLAFTAMACGGSETPPGGGSNGTGDGGGTTDGKTDNRNPLIDAIPGCWEIVSINCEREHEIFPTPVTVDPNDPDCDGDPVRTIYPESDPPGDACIDWFGDPRKFILDGDVIRCSYCQVEVGHQRADGRILEDGHRIVYTYERLNDSEPERPAGRYEIDARWVSAGTRDEFGNLRCNDRLDDEAEPRCTPTE